MSSRFVLPLVVLATFLLIFKGNTLIAQSGSSSTTQVSDSAKVFAKMTKEELSDYVFLDNFIRQFPDSKEARMAFAIQYDLLQQLPSIGGYNSFVEQYPQKLQSQIAIQEVFKQYRYQNTVAGYYDFIKRYPNTQQALVAMQIIQQLMFEYACTLDTEEEYNAFICAFPDAPQNEEAMKRALSKYQEHLKQVYEQFSNQKDEKKQKEIVNTEIQKWEDNFFNPFMLDFTSKNLNTEEAAIVWYGVYERAKKLKETFHGEDTGRVQDRFDTFFVAKNMDKNFTELIKTIEVESKIIQNCIVKLNEDILKGFGILHQDLVDINGKLVDIEKTLQKMDKHLEEINNSIVQGFEKTNQTLEKNFSVLIDKIQVSNQVPMMGIRRQPAYTVTKLSSVASSGYNDTNNFYWQSQDAEKKSGAMTDRFAYVSRANSPNSKSWIAKVAGTLVGAATTFIPVVGPYIAPAISRITEEATDSFVIPCIQKTYAKMTDSNEPQEFTDAFLESATEQAPEMIDHFKKVLPDLWEEQKDNLLTAVKKLADNYEIPADYIDPILADVKASNNKEALRKTLKPLAKTIAEKSNITEEAAEKAVFFASDYIYAGISERVNSTFEVSPQ